MSVIEQQTGSVQCRGPPAPGPAVTVCLEQLLVFLRSLAQANTRIILSNPRIFPQTSMKPVIR